MYLLSLSLSLSLSHPHTHILSSCLPTYISYLYYLYFYLISQVSIFRGLGDMLSTGAGEGRERTFSSAPHTHTHTHTHTLSLSLSLSLSLFSLSLSVCLYTSLFTFLMIHLISAWCRGRPQARVCFQRRGSFGESKREKEDLLLSEKN